MWLTYLILSVSSIGLAIVLSLIIHYYRGTQKKRVNLFNLLLAGVFWAAWFSFIPVEQSSSDGSVLGGIRTVFLAIFHSMQTFAFGCDFELVSDALESYEGKLNMIYQVWVSFIYVIAPIFTFGFVLSLFKNVSAYLRYLSSYFKDTYVFSELNEKSLVLANDIKSKNQDAAIVFTDVFEENEESVYELIEQADELGAICFKKDIMVVNFNRHSAQKSISFFAIGKNETENLNQSLKLIEQYRERDNTHIYIFSIKIESELLLTSVDKGKIKVRRINEVQSLVNRILYERGELIFNVPSQEGQTDKQISAVVVGLGNYGTQMLKSLTWFGQMDGYKLEINAFDKDPMAEDKIIALTPELMSPDYNGVDIEGEAQYKISIHAGLDVNSNSFVEKLMQITNATYVFVSLGNDDVNINTAVNLRMYFERMKIHPMIHAVVNNSQQKKALEGIKNYRGQPYDIEFVGDIETSFAEDVIIDSELEEAALQRHLKWGKEDEFWTYEYNYRSSMASAIHMQARIKCHIPGADKPEEELTEEERNGIEALEHRRWNAYMRSEGYVFSGSKDKSSRNDLAKMHHDLVDFSSLTEEDKRKDSKVGTR